MKTTEITSAARKIAKTHNAAVKRGMGGNGKLVFGFDGSGGAWYSDNSYGFGEDVLVVNMRHGNMSQATAQEILDNAGVQS